MMRKANGFMQWFIQQSVSTTVHTILVSKETMKQMISISLHRIISESSCLISKIKGLYYMSVLQIRVNSSALLSFCFI